MPHFEPSPKYGVKTSERYEVAKTISVMPAAFAMAIWCSVTGTPATVSIGLGVFLVSGINRVPNPPTNKIATAII